MEEENTIEEKTKIIFPIRNEDREFMVEGVVNSEPQYISREEAHKLVNTFGLVIDEETGRCYVPINIQRPYNAN